jgi:ureidoglycolate dehydrogenase (NAD+)
MSTVRLDSKIIRNFLERLFQAVKVPPEASKEISNSLVQASLRGVDSHGIRLAPHYVAAVKAGRVKPNVGINFKQTAPATGIVEAKHNFGIIAGTQAVWEAIKLAKKTGMGAVVVKNSSHFGAAFNYSLLAAKENMIGLSFTNTDSLVVPFGGRAAFLGTNPICFAVPVAGEEPFCLDMATTAISWNKLNMYKQENTKLEAGWAVDSQGKVTDDPKKARSLLPIGNYKGYGLGLMVEILCSLLSGMPFGRQIERMFPISGKHRQLGHFFMVIDISRFQSVGVFKKRMSLLLSALRAEPTASGFKRVLVAGDPEKLEYAIRSKRGIPVPQSLLEEFSVLAKDLSVPNLF